MRTRQLWLLIVVALLLAAPGRSELLVSGRVESDVRWGLVQREWEVYRGSRTVGGLPAGSYSVEVTAPDGRRWQGSVRVAPGAATPVSL